MDIDAHVHLWTYDPDRLGWIEPASVLAADHLVDDVAPMLAAAGVGGMILVQAEGSAAETAWLLDRARGDARVVGVVGWADLRAGDAADRIAALAAEPGLVGLRHQVQDEPDGFLLRDDVVAGVRACTAAGLAYDVLVFAHQAGDVPAFLDRVGDGRFVLDHGGKPSIAAGGWQPWADAVRRIAAHPGTWCKLSGLVTEARHDRWAVDDLARYMDHLLDCFGPDRLIYGSDWPVCRLAASYAQVHALAAEFVERRCPEARDRIFGGNAQAAYRVPASG